MTTPNSVDDSGPLPKKSMLSLDSQLNMSFQSFSSSQNSNSFMSSSQNELSTQSADESDGDEPTNTAPSSSSASHSSRKEKSLGILCRRFLVTMGENLREGTDIHLETVATRMDTEKRRIYDIVNVMEALEAMSKTNKSFYRWNTLASLPQLMESLKREARQDNLPKRIKDVEDAMCSFTELKAGQRTETVSSVVAGESSPLNFSPIDGRCTAETRAPSNSSALNLALRDRNGKNSLACLCRRFLMVLLCNPDDKRKVSLDVASTVLIKEPESEGYDPPSRSRCRRLYDIANVLVAMGLIKKVHYLFGTKKIPLFVYCGPEPTANSSEAQANMSEFVKQSGLAQPNDFTWAAIFGVPQTKSTLFRPLENLVSQSPVHHPLSSTKHSEFVKPNEPKQQQKRRVFGELDPINPRGQVFNSTQPLSHPVESNKRTFDGALKHLNAMNPNGNKENRRPVKLELENKENALPKPQPQNIPSTTQKPKTVEPSGSQYAAFMSSPFPFNQMAGFAPLMPNFPNAFQQQQQLYALGLRWQLCNALNAQQASQNLLNTSNTAFKPVPPPQQPTAKKPFGTSQTNR